MEKSIVRQGRIVAGALMLIAVAVAAGGPASAQQPGGGGAPGAPPAVAPGGPAGGGGATGIPQLAPAPGSLTPVAPVAKSNVKAFRCSCFGRGSPMVWTGTIRGVSRLRARQRATNACLTYNFNKRPASSFSRPRSFGVVPPPSGPPVAIGTNAGVLNLTAPGQSGSSLLSSPRAIVFRLCAQCACN